MVLRNNYTGYALLAAAALLPVVLSALFAWLQKRTRFGKLGYWTQQVIIGLAFSGLAVLATEFGIHIEGASINCRDAAPLAAGLLFGGPAGVIAGVVGGVERWFAASWGAGMYTRLACSVATVTAGLFGAVLHRSAFQRMRPAWWYMLAIGVGVEALHMLLIIWTHMNDLENAFAVAWACSIPMITANGLSLMFSAMAAAYIERGRLTKEDAFRNSLQVKLHRGLFRSIVIAFLATVVFSVAVEVQLAVEESEQQLSSSLNKVTDQLTEALNSGLKEYAEWIDSFLEGEGTDGSIPVGEPTEENALPWVYITDAEGTVLASNEPGTQGENVNTYGRAAELLSADEAVYVGTYQPSFFDQSQLRTYVGLERADGNRLIVGYGGTFLGRELERRAASGALSHNVGTDGSLSVLGADGSFPDGAEEVGTDWQEMLRSTAPGRLGVAEEAGGGDAFLMYEDITLPYGSYIAVATLPVAEAMFVSSVMSLLMILTEILIFLALFVHLSYLVRREVVSRIHSVNSSLSKITAGDLNEVVEVSSSSEFILLSGGINATIDTLKRYIDEAAARLDRELEFARTIQRAALPSVFPAFPARGEFDIYASMEAAKEVGGDFYDFYLLGDSTLILVIADVSGKGIPAAMFMMRAKTMLKNFTQSGVDIAEAFEKTNDALCENNEAQMFVTAWMGALNLETGVLRYVNAGHNPMLVAKSDSSFAYVRPAPGFVLAGIEGFHYVAGELTMQPGDAIYVYTDGVTEAQNTAGELFGDERLAASANRAREKSVQELCQAVSDDVNSFAGEAEQFDDMTMLAVRVNYLRGPEEIQLQPDADSPERVGAFLSEALRAAKIPETAANHIREQALQFWQQTVLPCGGSQARLQLHRHAAGLSLTFSSNGKSCPDSGNVEGSSEDGWHVWKLREPL